MPHTTDDQGNQWEIVQSRELLGMGQWVLRPAEKKTETTEQVRAEYNPETGEYHEKKAEYDNQPYTSTTFKCSLDCGVEVAHEHQAGDIKLIRLAKEGTNCTPVDKDFLIEQLEKIDRMFSLYDRYTVQTELQYIIRHLKNKND